MRGGDLVENERSVRHVIDGDLRTRLERQSDRRRSVSVVLGDEDALHTTKRRARTRRNIRSCVQSLQWHMRGIYAPAVPALSLGGGPRRNVRWPPAALSTAAWVVIRCGPFLFPVDHLLHVVLIDLRKAVLAGVEDGLVLLASRFGKRLGRVSLVFVIGIAHIVERVREALDRVGILLSRGRRRRRTLLGDLGELLEATVGETREQLHASHFIERQGELNVLARTVHGVKRIAGKAGRGCVRRAGEHQHEDGSRRKCGTKDRRKREPGRAGRKDDCGLGHEPPAELLSELLAHDRPLQNGRAPLVHARASRDGMSARSASSARNWIPRTVPSRLPTRSAISCVLYPSPARRARFRSSSPGPSGLTGSAGRVLGAGFT